MHKCCKLTLVPLVSITISSLYLISTYKSDAYNSTHDGKQLSYWYWIGANIRSLFGFSVNVIWPYVICNWISLKSGIFLTMYCYGIDSTFRLFWFYCKTYLYYNPSTRDMFLLFWAAANDINTFFVVPAVIYVVHNYYRKNQSDCKHQMYQLKEPLLIEETYTNCKEDSQNKHFNKIIIFYIITGLWFTGQDMYQYYESDLKYSALIRLPPILFATATFMWEVYACKLHNNKNMRFVHYSLMCLFIPVQQLYFDWTYFVVQIHDWYVLQQFEQNISNLFVFVLYTIYFQFISFVGFKLCQHISITIPNVVELNFIFMFYSEMFLTIYLSSTTTIDWSIFAMIIFKIIIKIIKFDYRVIQYVPFMTLNTEKLAKRYLYSILSATYVFMCRSALLIVDYNLNIDIWILPMPKSLNNFLTSTLILFMTFVGQCLAYLVIWKADTKQNYNWEALKGVPIHALYFMMVVVTSQIFSIFLPWFYLVKQ